MSRQRPVATWILALAVGLAALPGRVPAAAGRAADLRLEWRLGERAVTAGAPAVRGRAGERVEVPYRLRNVGGGAAWAVAIEARTALGPAGPAARLQPGPAAGATVDRALGLTLAVGMRELCVDARLETREPDEPGDPNRHDNRICRAVDVERPAGRRERSAPAPEETR